MAIDGSKFKAVNNRGLKPLCVSVMWMILAGSRSSRKRNISSIGPPFTSRRLFEVRHYGGKEARGLPAHDGAVIEGE